MTSTLTSTRTTSLDLGPAVDREGGDHLGGGDVVDGDVHGNGAVGDEGSGWQRRPASSSPAGC